MVGGAIERRFPLPTELRPATTLGDQFAPPQVREREQAAADLGHPPEQVNRLVPGRHAVM
jgi:hypothetical protein